MAIDFRIRDYSPPLRPALASPRFEETQWLPPSRLREFQEQRLEVIVSQACERVHYYRDLFAKLGLRPDDLRTLPDLEQLPLLSRETVRGTGDRLLADNADRYGPHPFTTSGTSGRPLTVHLDRHARVLEFV